MFYALSTTFVTAKDKDGKQSFYTTLSDEEIQVMQGEYEYMSTEIFDSEHFNFIAPYYRQVTFEAYEATERKELLAAMIPGVTDICDAFDYRYNVGSNRRCFCGMHKSAQPENRQVKHKRIRFISNDWL